MENLVFTQLSIPEVKQLFRQELESYFATEKQNKKTQQDTETDRWFDLNELCNYLPDKPAKPTVYGWVHACVIPCHKGGKKLRFLKSEIDVWLRTGKQKTVSEIATETDHYLNKKKEVRNA